MGVFGAKCRGKLREPGAGDGGALLFWDLLQISIARVRRVKILSFWNYS